MEYNIYDIISEINIIIKNKKKYTIKTILYALGVKESIDNIKITCVIDQIFIQLLEYLKPEINCYIDIDLFKYYYNNKKKILFLDNTATYSPTSSPSSSQEDLQVSINNMIINDSIIFNKIIDINNDKNKQIITQKLFISLDYDKNNYITPLDVINSKTCLEINYISVLIELLIQKPEGVDISTFATIV